MRFVLVADLPCGALSAREGVIGAPAIMRWLVTAMHIELEPLK